MKNQQVAGATPSGPRGKPLWFMLPLVFAVEAISTWAGACYRDHDWTFMLHPYLWMYAGPLLALSAWLFIRRRRDIRLSGQAQP